MTKQDAWAATLAAVPKAERAEWLAERWANALSSSKRMGERDKGLRERVETARATFANAEAALAPAEAARAEEQEFVAWCRAQVRALLAEKGA